MRKAGYEKPDTPDDDPDKKYYTYNPFTDSYEYLSEAAVDVPPDDCKLANNISRARETVYGYACCNDWDYFITATLNGLWYDRDDLDKFKKDMTKWADNYKQRHNPKFKYLLVPELHKDGHTWHMHGLLAGINDEDLEINQYKYLDFPKLSKKFGYVSLEKIRSRQRVARYVSKYITKELGALRDKHTRLFYASQGLKKPELLLKLTDMDVSDIAFDYYDESGYVRIATTESDAIVNYVLSRIKKNDHTAGWI